MTPQHQKRLFQLGAALAATTALSVLAYSVGQGCLQTQYGPVTINVPSPTVIHQDSNTICANGGNEGVCYRQEYGQSEMELIRGEDEED